MKWININEKKPENAQKVLIYETDENGKCVYATDVFHNRGGFFRNDTKWWMPLPEEPSIVDLIYKTPEKPPEVKQMYGSLSNPHKLKNEP